MLIFTNAAEFLHFNATFVWTESVIQCHLHLSLLHGLCSITHQDMNMKSKDFCPRQPAE